MAHLHHSNIVLSRGDGRKIVFDILEKDLNFQIERNPDFLLLENDSFGIDDVRELERWSLCKPFGGEVKVSLLVLNSITFEAQNALLKILEEPPLGTYFFITLGSLGNILPTLLSRVRVLDFSRLASDAVLDKDVAKDFLRSGLKQKLSLIKNLAKSENKSDMKNLIRDLERVAYDGKSKPDSMKNILIAKTLSSVRGSSPKMLLEWLSCMI